MELDKLLISIASSVQQAQEAIEQNSLSQYFDFFNRERVFSQPVSKDDIASNESDIKADVFWTPKTEVIAVPKSDGSIGKIDVPVVALANHGQIKLSEVKIKLKVGLSSDYKTGKVVANVERSEPDKPETQNEIEMTFKREEPSEGISRINQESINLL